MNEPRRPPVQVGPIHYQILCGAGLLLIFFVQLDQGLFLGNLLVLCVGLVGIFVRMRLAPLLLLMAFAAAQIGFYYQLQFNTFARDSIRPLLDVRDLLLAMGVLCYVAANTRLQSLAMNILPDDPRQQKEQVRRAGRRKWRELAAVPQKRASRLLTPQEIAAFVLTLPLWALAGQGLWYVILRPWGEVFHERVFRLLTVAWLLIVGVLVAGTILAQWRRRQMDRTTAALYLQDTLWRETRREQRRIFRWLAWRRLHERTQEQSH